LQTDVTVIIVGCAFWGKSFENYEKSLCAEGTFRRHIFTEVVSAQAEEINVLASYLLLVKRPRALETA
jgi:hypothetical protein